MKQFYIIGLLASMLFVTPALGQVTISDLTAGTANYSESIILDSNSNTVSSATSFLLDTEVVKVGRARYENTFSGGVSRVSSSFQGVFEFNMASVDVPTSITSNNFTARLFIYDGELTTAAVGSSVSLNVYELDSSSEDGMISRLDLDNWVDIDAPLNEEPVLNAVFDEFGYDVTQKIRENLFGSDSGTGSDTDSDYIGFIFVPGDQTDNLGAVEFATFTPYIEINRVTDTADTGSDDTDTDSATETVAPDTADTDSDTALDVEIDDPDVACKCSTPGARAFTSLFKLLL